MEINQESKKIKVMIVEDEEKIRRSITEFLSKDKRIDVCAFFTSGFDIISEIKFYKPDVIITDFLATDVNGAGILKVISMCMDQNRPKVIVTLEKDNIGVLEKLFKLGIDYYVKKPIALSFLKDVIFLVCKDKRRTDLCDGSLKIRIKNLLKLVGVPTNILGYKYIEESLFHMISYNKVAFLSEIYEEIGTKYDTSLKCVEVSISNAIKKAKKLCNNEFKMIFNFCDCNPSNSVFLSGLKEKIIIEEINIWNV